MLPPQRPYIRRCAQPEDYYQVGEHYQLPSHFPAYPGCFCKDPHIGAREYNLFLIKKHFPSIKKAPFRWRFTELLRKYPNNRRIQKLSQIEWLRPFATEDLSRSERYLLYWFTLLYGDKRRG